jgi:cytochrome c oxidase assembly protein subunit 11
VKKQERANRRLTTKLFVIALAMFGFGYALIPLYDVFCEITGINSPRLRSAAEAPTGGAVDTSRTITVELNGSVMNGLPWSFAPVERRISVHPGEVAVARFKVRNNANETIIGQAVPSVLPPKGSNHLKKLECFCFSQQPLAAGESKEMAVRFVVDTKLSAEISTLTLSYAFFNADQASSRKYGGDGQAHDHGQHGQHGG